MNGHSANAIIETRGISKHYGHVQALSEVSIRISPGEVVGLVGDNGAGKSTLVNILSGAIRPSSGSILIDGRETSFRSPLDARRQGIETVYQDLALAPHLSVWANTFLGREQTVRGPLGWFGWLDKKSMQARAEEELRQVKITIGSVRTTCDALSGGQRQAVAVAKAVAWGTRILLLDEPTAALGVEQQEKVGALIRTVRDRGIPVLLISHNLPQVHQICDRMLVLLHGRVVAELDAARTPIEQTVLWITGAMAEGGGRGH